MAEKSAAEVVCAALLFNKTSVKSSTIVLLPSSATVLKKRVSGPDRFHLPASMQ